MSYRKMTLVRIVRRECSKAHRRMGTAVRATCGTAASRLVENENWILYRR